MTLRICGDEPHATRLFELLVEHRLHPPLEAALDVFDDFGIRLFHVGDAADHLDLLVGRQPRENFGRHVGRQMRHDEGNRLRMFLDDEGENVLGPHLVQEAERHRVDRVADVLQDFARPLGAEGLLQKIVGKVDAAALDRHALPCHAAELAEDGFDLVLGDVVDLGDLERDRLHEGLGKLAQDLGRDRLFEAEQ